MSKKLSTILVKLFMKFWVQLVSAKHDEDGPILREAVTSLYLSSAFNKTSFNRVLFCRDFLFIYFDICLLRGFVNPTLLGAKSVFTFSSLSTWSTGAVNRPTIWYTPHLCCCLLMPQLWTLYPKNSLC